MNKTSVIELMVRYGIMVEANESGIICTDSNKENQQHFAKVSEKLRQQEIDLNGEMMEAEFINILEELYESTGESLFSPETLAIHTVDMYVRGLVMQLNRLRCLTTNSCDGHDRCRAHIYFATVKEARRAKILLEHVGLDCQMENKELQFQVERYELPKFVSALSKLTIPDAIKIVTENSPFMLEEKYYALLEE